MAHTKILVVEDNPLSRELVVDLLENAGYTVVQFQDGANLVERVKQERPDLILLDLLLPGVDGLTLAQQLRADPETREVAIVALSAEARSEKQALALEAGFHSYVTKPLDKEALLQTIARLLEQRAPTNGGSTRRFHLPASPKHPRLLVVDDNARNVELLTALMQAEGYRVTSASDGLDALTQVAAAPPDLIVLDIMMPGLDGYAVCRQLKERSETRLVPIVLLTALGAEEHLIRGIESGADDFLTKPFSQAELKARVRSLLKLKAYTDELEHAETMLLMLGRTVEARDRYTQGHCERLSAYSVALGRALGLSWEELMALDRGGFLHDLGKIGIPDSILLKPTALSEAEWRIMREHPAIGERICLPLSTLKPVLPIIRHHHERWDGSGYPDGLSGDAIPLTARILQVVDIFDALTTARPYKPALSQADAVRALQNEVVLGWRDPRVVRPFIELVERRGLPALPQA